MMTPHAVDVTDDEDPLLSLANLLLRRRWLIGGLATVGAVLGLLSGLLRSRVYISQTTFLPQTTDASLSGLAVAASQFGVRLPTNSAGGWGPPVYAEILQSRALLLPIALDTVVVAEEDNRRVALSDLLKVEATNAAEKGDRAVLALKQVIASHEVKNLSAVQINVTTKWPSVSFAIAQRLVSGVSQFNLESRKSQATAERKFVETQAAEAATALRQAEDRQLAFLRANRVISGSPELESQRDHLQRDVGLRQQVYTTLMQSYEEARIREVRDTPVITVLEEAQVPTLPAARRSALKAAVGLLAGGLLGLLAGFIIERLAVARREPSPQTREFLELMDSLLPRGLRRQPR